MCMCRVIPCAVEEFKELPDYDCWRMDIGA
jgi:hypothetical protein